MEFLDITNWQKTQVFLLHAIYSLFYTVKKRWSGYATLA